MYARIFHQLVLFLSLIAYTKCTDFAIITNGYNAAGKGQEITPKRAPFVTTVSGLPNRAGSASVIISGNGEVYITGGYTDNNIMHTVAEVDKYSYQTGK